MQDTNRKKFLKKFLAASVAIGVMNFSPVISYENNLQIVSVARAEIRTYEAVGRAEFNFGENNPQLIEMAKNYARMNAEQNAKEKAGIYLKSISRTVNGVLTDDDISAVTNSSVKTIDVKFKQMPYVSHDIHGSATGEIGIAYEATVTVKVDSDELSKYVQRNPEEKFVSIEQNKSSQKKIADINKQIEELKNNPQKATSTDIQEINNEILSQQKFDEGNKLYARKDYQGAISRYNEVIKWNPNYEAVYYNRGSAYYYLRNYEQAIKDFSKSIELNPKYAPAYNGIGVIYRNLKNYEQAIKNYNKAIEIDPINSSMTYTNRGNVYHDLKNYLQAIEDHNRALEINPNDYTIYNNRGNVYRDSNNYDLAIKDYNKSIELAPNYAVPYHNRGITWIFLLKIDNAISDFNKAIQLDPNLANAYVARGLCYQSLGQNSKAKEDFDKARQLGYGKDKSVESPKNDDNFVSDDSSVYLKRGDLYIKSKNPSKAIPEYTKAIELNPKYVEAYFHRAIAYGLLRDNKNAVADFTEIIRLNPKDARIYYHRGLCYKAMGDRAKAKADFVKAKELGYKG